MTANAMFDALVWGAILGEPPRWGACEAWQTFLSSTYSDDHSRISQPNFAAPTCCWLRVYNVERKSSACGYQRHWGIVRIVSPIVYF